MSAADYSVRRVEAEQMWPLRQKLLRAHQPIEDSRYPGDEHRDAGHYGAFQGHKMVGIASIFHEAHPDIIDRSGEQQWRLRGMATAEAVRGTGAGSALLLAAIEHAVTRHGQVLWCNARTPAVGFYQRHGFAVIGDEFEIVPIGPHYLMRYSPDSSE